MPFPSEECFVQWIFAKAHIIWWMLTNIYTMFGCKADVNLKVAHKQAERIGKCKMVMSLLFLFYMIIHNESCVVDTSAANEEERSSSAGPSERLYATESTCTWRTPDPSALLQWVWAPLRTRTHTHFHKRYSVTHLVHNPSSSCSANDPFVPWLAYCMCVSR